MSAAKCSAHLRVPAVDRVELLAEPALDRHLELATTERTKPSVMERARRHVFNKHVFTTPLLAIVSPGVGGRRARAGGNHRAGREWLQQPGLEARDAAASWATGPAVAAGAGGVRNDRRKAGRGRGTETGRAPRGTGGMECKPA